VAFSSPGKADRTARRRASPAQAAGMLCPALPEGAGHILLCQSRRGAPFAARPEANGHRIITDAVETVA